MTRTLAWMLTGGIIGGLAGLLWTASGLYLLAAAGALLGVVGGVLSTAFSMGTSSPDPETARSGKDAEEQTLQLREEVLEVATRREQTGEVLVHTEIEEENRTITVPLRREVLVIETKGTAGEDIEPSQVIRIPVREEEIQVSKRPVDLAAVTLSKTEVQGSKRVKDTLRKEVLRMEMSGQTDMVEELPSSDEARPLP